MKMETRTQTKTKDESGPVHFILRGKKLKFFDVPPFLY